MTQENGHSMNGHNGHPSRGALGGGTPEGPGIRSALETTRKLAEAGKLAAAEVPGAIKMAAKIASGTGTDRDRIAALKALAALAKYGSEAELELDKLRRLDAGEATDRVETREVKVTVPRVGRLSE